MKRYIYFFLRYFLFFKMENLIEFNQDVIVRTVINDSVDENESSLRIELYKLNVNLSCSVNWKKTTKTLVAEEMSRQTTLGLWTYLFFYFYIKLNDFVMILRGNNRKNEKYI